MAKQMFIDATHPEETRVVVLDGNRVDEFDFESQARRQLRGNIYLARVTRVEPSLQAAFVEYGGNRHGFLAFNEIHPDYYQIPHDDRQKLIEEEKKAVEAAAARDERVGEGEEEASEADDQGSGPPRSSYMRNYKIQEVIKRRQILLVQVVKEERGNKGAALTTYLSLAGRYCVLMPNTARGGGISRKITSATDRKRLKKAAAELEVPEGMGLIIRTAGAKRTKAEIKRDADYLMRLWKDIRDLTFKSIAPALIYEESNLVKRAIRDIYDKDIDGILVDGEPAYREAKDFIRMLMPSHAKKVQPYREATPLFLKHGIEEQLEEIYQPVVQLKSGGYLVINQTEALVAIDVNSGRATRERNIEATALKTNMEAAEEACRQFRLRDLAGLIVIDFIDMEEAKNNRAVEKKMRDCLKRDRARVQAGKISSFGLMELSRQRRRANLLEGSHVECPTCKGRGIVRSPESSALHVLRRIEEEGLEGRSKVIRVRTDPRVALYLLNEKRTSLNALQERYGMTAFIDADAALVPPELEIERVEEWSPGDERPAAPALPAPVEEDDAIDAALAEAEGEDADDEDEGADEDAGTSETAAEDEKPKRRRRRRRRKPSGDAPPRETTAAEADAESETSEDGGEADTEAEADAETGEEKPKRRRRRGRRGGRGRRTSETGASQEDATAGEQGPEAMRVIELEEPDTTPALEPPPARPALEPPRADAEPAGEDDADVLVEEAPASAPAPVADVEETAFEDDDEEEEAAPTPRQPAATAETDEEAEERRRRWQKRVRSWLGG